MKSEVGGRNKKTNKSAIEFKKVVWNHWRLNGRHTLPWRKTRDPYRIFVSELMLQQTQVDRVIPYYRAFLSEFPKVRDLAKAPLSKVLKHWSGLGYNRRAKYLLETAKTVVQEFAGKFPRKYDELRKLPGVGDYTARAVRVFAFNEPDVLIETNIRTVYFHHLDMFHKPHDRDTYGTYTDAEILPLVTEAAREEDPREWHWALMDYGAYLKKNGVKLNSKSSHYIKQSKFEGSNRQLRGKVLRSLLEGSKRQKALAAHGAENDVDAVLQSLEKEGLVVKSNGAWKLP